MIFDDDDYRQPLTVPGELWGTSQQFEVSPTMLEPMRVGAAIRTTARIEVDDLHRVMFNELVWRIEAAVLKETLAEEFYTDTVYWEYPSTTWQMFKSRHADSWWMRRFVKRYPVERETHSREIKVALEHSYIYPESDLIVPALGRPIKFEQAKRIL